MTNQNNQNDPLDAELDGALRKMSKEIHPRPAFMAKLRGELETQAAHPRRDFWRLLNLARPWLTQAVLIAALVALVLVAGNLAGRLFAPDGGNPRETGAQATPAVAAGDPAGNPSDSLPVGALARLGKGKIQSIDAAPDGRIAVGSTAGLCVYNTGLTPDWCRWTDSPVHAALFDPTGTRLAVRYGTKPEVEIWDTALGQVIASREFAEPSSPISGGGPLAAFWNIGMVWEPVQTERVSRLAITENNRSLSLWDWQQDAIAWGPVTINDVPLGIEWAAVPGGESVLAVLTQENAHLFNGQTGERMGGIDGLFPSPLVGLSALDLATDGARMTVAMPEGIYWIALDGFRPVSTQPVQEGIDVMRLSLSSDSALLAAQMGEEILTYDPQTGQDIASIRSMPVSPMAWNPTDGRLYYASPDGSLASFDGRLEGAVIASGHTLAPQFAAWRNENTVVTASGRFIYTWDTATQSLASFGEMTLSDSAYAAGLSKDGYRAVFFDPTANRMIVWDVAQNQPLHDFRSSWFLHAVTLSSDGTHLAAVNEDGQILTWKLLDNGAEERDIPGIRDFTSIEALAFHPGGETITIAYTKEDGSAALENWMIPTQSFLDRPTPVSSDPPDPPFTDLVWSIDEGYLGATQGQRIVVWDMVNILQVIQHTPQGDDGYPLQVLEFNPMRPGSLAAAGHQVHYFSYDAWTNFSGHTLTVTDLAFQPDGEALASASNDGTVILWNLGSASLPPMEIMPTATPLSVPDPIQTETPIAPIVATRTPMIEPTSPVQEYKVVEGDTCAGIAYTFNVSVESIITDNNLGSDCSGLVVGQVLLIPYPTPTPLPTNPFEAYPAPDGLTETPPPTRTTMPGQPTPLPNATQHTMPDTTGYDVTQTDGISPSGKWRWIAIRGEWQPGAPREEDLNIIIAASTDGVQTWVLEEYTPHGLGEGKPSGFLFSFDDRYLFFYNEGTPDGCGQPWQNNLRRMNLETGIVEPVTPVSQAPVKKFVFSPDSYRISMVTRTDIEIHSALRLEPGEKSLLFQIPLPFQPPNDWSVPAIIWQPSATSTLLAFEFVSPLESLCNTPSPDQRRWTVIADTMYGTAWSYSTPAGYTLNRWKEGEHWSQQLDPPPDGELVYRASDGSEVTVNPRTGEVIP